MIHHLFRKCGVTQPLYFRKGGVFQQGAIYHACMHACMHACLIMVWCCDFYKVTSSCHVLQFTCCLQYMPSCMPSTATSSATDRCNLLYIQSLPPHQLLHLFHQILVLKGKSSISMALSLVAALGWAGHAKVSLYKLYIYAMHGMHGHAWLMPNVPSGPLHDINCLPHSGSRGRNWSSVDVNAHGMSQL
jgi:hypothetical protein